MCKRKRVHSAKKRPPHQSLLQVAPSRTKRRARRPIRCGQCLAILRPPAVSPPCARHLALAVLPARRLQAEGGGERARHGATGGGVPGGGQRVLPACVVRAQARPLHAAHGHRECTRLRGHQHQHQRLCFQAFIIPALKLFALS
jgi:hypothetical protein